MRQKQPPALWSIMIAVIAMLWVLDDVSRQVAHHPSTIFLVPVAFLVLIGDYVFRLSRTSPESKIDRSRPRAANTPQIYTFEETNVTIVLSLFKKIPRMQLN